MRDLVNIGRDEILYVDAELIIAILPDTNKGFGSFVVAQGLNAPVATSLNPEDVMKRLHKGLNIVPKILNLPEKGDE